MKAMVLVRLALDGECIVGAERIGGVGPRVTGTLVRMATRTSIRECALVRPEWAA